MFTLLNLHPLNNNKSPFNQASLEYQILALHMTETKSGWTNITEVTYCLAKDMMTIQTVEKEGLMQLVKMFDPRYTKPGNKYYKVRLV